MFVAVSTRTMANARFAPPKDEPEIIDWLALQRRKREAAQARRAAERDEAQRIRDELRELMRRANAAARRARAAPWQKGGSIDFDTVMRRICKATGVTRMEIMSPTRGKRVAFARQAICYWAARCAGLSDCEIGRLLGRDHTTALHGRRAYPDKRAAQGRHLRPAR